MSVTASIGLAVSGTIDHVDERHHHLAHGRLAEVEDVVDHLRLLRRDVRFARLHLQEVLQLLARDEVADVGLLAAHEPEQQADTMACENATNGARSADAQTSGR